MKKITVKNIEKSCRESGFGYDAVKHHGFIVTIATEGVTGMLYAGWNGEAVAKDGKELQFFYCAPSLEACLHAIQNDFQKYNLETGYETIIMRTPWYAASTHSRYDYNKGPFPSQHEAEASARYPDWVKEGEAEYSSAVKIDVIINLTQHAGTPDQGVLEPENKPAVQAALTFDAIPSFEDMNKRALFLADVALDAGATKAMIGGAPFFMSTLERALTAAGIKPVYAFSVRESTEETDGNGGVLKVNIFRHAGWVNISE